ncbi:peroxiredoxin type II [Haematococcus lacustris]
MSGAQRLVSLLQSAVLQSSRFSTCGSQAFSSTRSFAAQAATLPTRIAGDVPPGHLDSDLSPTVCHIGLGRRRDLTMRQDLCLWLGGEKRSLASLFKGKKVMVVGFPGGKVCTEKHIPGYVQMTDMFERKGVDKVLCVTPMDPAAVQELASRPGLTSPKVELVSDKGGAFVRLLGLELGSQAEGGPQCQRYAGIVEDGILLKVKVERSPAELQHTDAKSMCELWEAVYGHVPSQQ